MGRCWGLREEAGGLPGGRARLARSLGVAQTGGCCLVSSTGRRAGRHLGASPENMPAPSVSRREGGGQGQEACNAPSVAAGEEQSGVTEESGPEQLSSVNLPIPRHSLAGPRSSPWTQ